MGEVLEGTFQATPEKGQVSSILMRPERARQLIVMGHGAGANMRSKNMANIANALRNENIASFRYQFPYMERGGGGRDSQAVSLATVRSALAAASAAVPGLELYAGGHSFGGRMTSLAVAEADIPGLQGLVFFSFPLHPSGKPSISRSDHLHDVNLPLLFLSGDRDKLASLDLLQGVVTELGQRATLHLIETADHGFNVLKRTRSNPLDVHTEMARTISEWCGRPGWARGRA